MSLDMLRNLTITKRIWASFILLILSLFVIIGIFYPISLQKTLKEESFKIIENQQLEYIKPGLSNLQPDNKKDSGVGFYGRKDAARSVGHLVVTKNLQQRTGNPIPVMILKKMADHAKSQNQQVGDYELKYHGDTLFYVVRRLQFSDGTNGYLFSYMWDTYRNQMITKLWTRLILVLGLAAAVTLIFAYYLTKYLKRPLNALGKRFEQIANFNWRQPFEWKSGDEFEKLADQFESMRRALVNYDESQKNFLQQASHELKTPVMVIQSYAQSVKDGISPRDQMDDTMDIIISEAGVMSERIKKLIYYTRVDSLKDEKPQLVDTVFEEIAIPVIDRLQLQRPELKISSEGLGAPLLIDRDQGKTLLENLIENALRYAETAVIVSAREGEGETIIEIKNDGESIPQEKIDQLFEPFHTGNKGQFGLGLAIVKRIVDRHDGKVNVRNEAGGGVSFIIGLPLKSDQSKNIDKK